MKGNIQITLAEEGKTLAVAGGNYRVITTGEMTDGNYAVIEMTVPPGGGPPPHSHPYMQEMFYIIEGTVEFRTQFRRSILKKGGFINIPLGGDIHSFKNTGNTVAKLLCTVVPAGLEKIFEMIGIPVGPGEFLPPPPLTEDRKAFLEKIDQEHRQTTYPADFLDKFKLKLSL